MNFESGGHTVKDDLGVLFCLDLHIANVLHRHKLQPAVPGPSFDLPSFMPSPNAIASHGNVFDDKTAISVRDGDRIVRGNTDPATFPRMFVAVDLIKSG